VFTETAFGRLLEWLDDGVDSNGETYLEIRRRLVSYFDRRNRLSADELADETLSRIGRTLEKDGTIAVRPPARYCYVVAKFVLLEDIRRSASMSASTKARCGGIEDARKGALRARRGTTAREAPRGHRILPAETEAGPARVDHQAAATPNGDQRAATWRSGWVSP
jgi:hypothetical protein